MKHLPKIPKLIWRRLPYIALYALAIFTLLSLGQRLYNRQATAEHFLHYQTVIPVTSEEHTDVPFTACKTVHADITVTGDRQIFKIPEDKDKNHAVIVGQYHLSGGSIPKEQCVGSFVKAKDFDHSVGTYFFRTIFHFKIQGYDKTVVFDSSPYNIIPKRLTTVEELQKRIDELQVELNILQAQLELAKHGVPVSVVDPTTATVTPAPAATQPAAATSNPATPPPATQPAPPPDQGLIPNNIPILGRL